MESHAVPLTSISSRQNRDLPPSACSPEVWPVLQFLTHNVRGLAKTKGRPMAWFDGPRARHHQGMVDAIFLQDIKAAGDWSCRLSAMHTRAWCFDPSRLAEPLSHWSRPATAAGGVAVLLHPHSPLRSLRPIWKDWWGPHFLALSGMIGPNTITLVCIYAPTEPRTRERLFDGWCSRTPPAGLLVVGGDFNCTLDDEFDRNYVSRVTHDSPALRRLFRRWRLIDVLEPVKHSIQTTADVQDFQADMHTYRYEVQSIEGRASSRLDRWYITSSELDRVDSVLTTPSCSESDHDGVLLLLAQPRATVAPSGLPQPRRIRYPLPEYARAAMHQVSLDKIVQLKHSVSSQSCTPISWDDWKLAVRREMLGARHHCAKKMTASWKQRLRRLRAALRSAELQLLLSTAQLLQSSVDALSVRFARLSLGPAARAQSLRAEIIALQQRRTEFRRNRMFERYSGRSPAATKAFFGRFAQRAAVIHSAQPSRRHVHPDGL